MALAKVPIVPQWNLSSGCVATAGGGFLYIGARTINYISKIKDGLLPPIIKVFHTRQTILSLAVDPDWSEDKESQKRHFAVLAQDNSIQIWDFNRGCAVSGHKAHFTTMSYEGSGAHTYEKVLLSYMSNRNVLSIGSADIVVYCVASNSFCRKPTFISSRGQYLTVLRCSPYNENIFAVGTSRGLVLVCDLQQMHIIYTLRGHDSPISALSWIMVDEQALDSVTNNTTTSAKTNHGPRKNCGPSVAAMSGAGGDDIFDIYDYDYLDNEFGAPVDTNDFKSKSEGSEFVGIEKPIESTETTTKFDFVEACQSLREEIDSINHEEPNVNDEVTLEDCQQVEKQAYISPSCSNESTEGSLELIYRSSDEDVDVDGTEPKASKNLAGSLIAEKQQILHKAEVHSPQTLEKVENNPQQKSACPPTEQELNKTLENKQEINHDVLLASASLDASFWIWNTNTGAACDQLRARGAGHGKNSHIEIIWLTATTFLTTNRIGDITCWNMLPDQSPVHRYKFKEEKRQFIQRGVVSFSVCKNSKSIWTISSYREISCEEILTKKLIAKYCCASTNISAMRECPDDMNKIALGFSDRRIGIIDISKLSSTNVSIENFTQRIDSPVLSLAWSPDNKKLAFGTVEGRVGILNIENSKMQTFTFNPFCGKPIYSMDWNDKHIFVCCNEKLATYDDNMNNKDAHVLHSIQSVSAISVRNELLFVGTQRGRLQVFRKNSGLAPKLSFDLIQDIEIAPRYITEIAWSPIASEQFAVISMANKIHIFNLNEATGNATHVRKIEIKNTKAANACVKWSNRSKSDFLTCGFDGAIRVWDLNSNNEDEKFLKQFHCPMTCGLFLPTDENIIICAGKSTSVEMFNISTEKSEDYSASKWKHFNSNTLENVQWALKMNARPDAKATTAAEKRKQRRSKDKVDGSADTTLVEANGNDIANEMPNKKKNEEISIMLNNLKIVEHRKDTDNLKTESCNVSVYMKNPVTLLYLTTKEINKDALEKLNFILSQENYRNAFKSLNTAKLFGSKLEARELLQEELRNHQHSERKGIANLLMPQLSSNMKDEILKCIQNKQLNEWHVSLAPTISYNFWQKCCQAFSEQLMEQGYALQAATYMTAIHNQTQAIQMLVEKNYYKEALLMARAYLQADEPLLHTITDKWIAYLDFTGNLAGAALLCTLSGQINRAYEVLSKVRNTHPDNERALQLLKTNDRFQ